MKTTANYLDAVKTALNLPSDYALAKYWGVSKQDISEYRAGKRTLGEDRAIAVAHILGIDPAEPLIASHAERAKSEAAREVWTALFNKLSDKLSASFTDLLLANGLRTLVGVARR
jgi:predicted transcriptional regulator